MVEKLRSAQAGAAFDQDYLKGQLLFHLVSRLRANVHRRHHQSGVR